MIIPFGDYKPDLPILGNAGATTAKNVIPAVVGYQPMKSMAAYSDDLIAYCRGAFSVAGSDGNVRTFSGDEEDLYRLVGTTQTKSSSTASAYACGADSYWEFAKFDDQVLATNYDDAIQYMALNGTAFATLSANAPKAKHIAIVRDFVMVGYTYDAVDNAVPNRVRWSGLDDSSTWTVSATTQADYQDLQGSGGVVQCIIGGERGLVFQERAIWLASYVGSPIVFQFDKIEDGRGALCPRGQIQVGGVVYYIADDGFYAITGGQSVPIGAGKVDKTFLDDLDHTYKFRVTTAAFPEEKVVVWSYPNAESVSGTPNKIIMYNWVSQKWSTAEFDHELIFKAMTSGVTLEGLDAINANLDSLAYSLDSNVWKGGVPHLASFDTSHQLAYLTGTALEATIETGEFQPEGMEGMRSEITELTSVVDGGTHTAQMGSRETQAATVAWGNVATENSSGITEVRANARYHRVRQIITGGFTSASGVMVKARPVGER